MVHFVVLFLQLVLICLLIFLTVSQILELALTLIFSHQLRLFSDTDFVTVAAVNLALNKPAYQSSINGVGPASYAVGTLLVFH